MVNLFVPFNIVVASAVSNLKLNKPTKPIQTRHFGYGHYLNMSVLDDVFKLNKRCIKTIEIFAAQGKSFGAIFHSRSLDCFYSKT